MFTTFVLLSGHPAGFFFWPKSPFPEILDMVIFQKSEFWSKTRFLGQLFGDMSHKSCSYGPYGPFRFSLKSQFWYVNFHQNPDSWGKTHFSRFLYKWINFIRLFWISHFFPPPPRTWADHGCDCHMQGLYWFIYVRCAMSYLTQNTKEEELAAPRVDCWEHIWTVS